MKNLLTLESFADWCEKQPAEKRYSYSNGCGPCAYHQYLAWHGFDVDFVSIDFWRDNTGRNHHLPRPIDRAVLGDGYFDYSSHTFGALASRLRAAIAGQRQ